MGVPFLLSEAEEIPQDAGKVIKWYNQADFITAFAGIIAITVGTIGIVDSLFMSGVDKKKGIGGPFHGDWFSGDTPPLILYGIATAAAWTCSLRAIFRIVSIETTPILARGVRQRDLSDMFEMKIPSKRWLYFRFQMWKTTVFASLCVLVYGGAALTYRLAFTTGEKYEFEVMNDDVYPLLGCNGYDYSSVSITGRLAMFEHLIMPSHGIGGIFAPASQNFSNSTSQTSPLGWGVQFGWFHLVEPLTIFSRTMANYGWWQSPVLVGLTQVVTGAEKARNKTIEVATHPQCGSLLKSCTEDGASCYWLGLGGGIFNVSYKVDISSTIQKREIVAGSWASTEGPSHCPMHLNSSVYEQVVQDMADDSGMDVFDPGSRYIGGDGNQYLRNQTIHALLIARLHSDHSLITNPAPLIDLSLLQPSKTECSSNQRIDGESWYPTSVDFYPQYEFTSSGLLVLWGLLLLFAAWPFRRLLVSGSLNQWMSFGANIGRDNMCGASSGHANAHSKAVWRLRAGITVFDVGHIGFEEIVGKEAVSRLEKISLGKRYV